MSNENDLCRIGISMPGNLLDQFDKIIGERGYSSRSEGIRDAVRAYITNYTWMSEVKGERHGIISMVYNHNNHGLLKIVNDIQNDFRSTIQTTLHAHVNHDKSLDILVVHDEGEQIKVLTERFMAVKGIDLVKLSTMQIEE
jgi:CopG family nickel-responsive transcriptional regulator